MGNWKEQIRQFFLERKEQALRQMEWEKLAERDQEKREAKVHEDRERRLRAVRYTLGTAGVPELLGRVKKDGWKKGSIQDLLNNDYDKEIIGLVLRHIRRGTRDDSHTDISGERIHSSTKGWVVDSLAVSFSETSFWFDGPQLSISDTQSFYTSYAEAGDKIDLYDSSWYSKGSRIPVVVDTVTLKKNMEDVVLQLCKERILDGKLPTDPI